MCRIKLTYIFSSVQDVVLLLLTREHNRVVNPNLFGRCRVGGSLHIAAMRGDVALARKLLVDGAMVSRRSRIRTCRDGKRSHTEGAVSHDTYGDSTWR